VDDSDTVVEADLDENDTLVDVLFPEDGMVVSDMDEAIVAGVSETVDPVPR